MASKGTKVTQKEVKQMVILYQRLGSYKLVAKKMRRNPQTVAKYIQQYEVSKMTTDILKAQGIITKAEFMDIYELGGAY